MRTGDTITPFYDPMIAKIITHGATRDEALNRLDAALNKTRIAGLVTNRQFLSALCNLEAFRTGDVDTGLIGRETAALFTDAQPSDIAFALAALGALDLLDAPEKADPWSGLRGFRLWGEASRSVLIEHHGERRTVSFTARATGISALLSAPWTFARTRTDWFALPLMVACRKHRSHASGMM